MSPRGWQNRIRDILEAIAEIQSFTSDLDYETFKQDNKAIRAVEMNFIIIGEAAYQIPEEIEEKHAMRNRIVHAYFEVDEKLMWDTVQNDLPPLIPEMEKLL